MGQTFEKYKKRLILEGVIKSLFSGLIVGCGVNFTVAFVTWFTAFEGLWLAIGLGIAALAVSAPLFYIFKFKPTSEAIARRIDRLGLDERIVTMRELENDTSYIAMRQREDAMRHLETVNAKNIKFKFSAFLIALVIVCPVAAAGMTTVSALSDSGIIPGPIDPGDGDEKITYYEVEYTVDNDDAGEIIGADPIQVVAEGETTEWVTAVAAEGWQFDGWDDGYKEATRCDMDITDNMVFTAMFTEVEEGDGDEGEPGDQPDDQPADPSNGDNNGDNNNSGTPGVPPDFGSSTIIDGDTYYKLVYEEYYQKAMQYLAENEDIPDHLRKMIESYFNILL